MNKHHFLTARFCVGIMSLMPLTFQAQNSQKATQQDSIPTTILKEVSVKARRDLYKTRPDVIIYDVKADSSLIGKSSFDALRNVPLLNVERNGNVHSVGDWPIEYTVNGAHDRTISGNIHDALESLDAKYLKRIEVLEFKDFHVLNDNISKMLLPYGSNMAGGAVFIRRENFNSTGGEDENFYGWGVEDWNRIEKWKKYGNRIERAHGPLFHLTHPRDINGRINSKWQKRNAYNTLRHTKESNFKEIKERNALVHNKRKLSDKLHIGCGNCLLDGWINTDIKPCSNDILYMDLTKPFPFQDNFFKYIFSEHVCEHVTFKDYLSTLREIHRVLKPGGIYRVAMPTLDFLLNLYDKPNNALHSKYIQWSNTSFGFADYCLKSFTSKDLAVITLNNFMHNWGHKFIYSNEMIEHILKIAGFRNVKRCNIGESRYPELRGLEQHGTQIPNWANQLETVVYEGEKET